MNTVTPIKRTIVVAMVAALVLSSGCSRDAPQASREAPDGPLLAVAELSPTRNHAVSGTVRFLREGSGIRVVAEITGLSVGEHGFHIHEQGDCSAPDASSAGGHFNPTAQPHGARDMVARHIGDLGNITADEDGRAQLDFLDAGIEVTGPHSILNRSVVVHQGRDDLTSQPSGESGARVACGVIRAP